MLGVRAEKGPLAEGMWFPKIKEDQEWKLRKCRAFRGKIQGAASPTPPPKKGLGRKGTAPLKVGWMGKGKRPKNEQPSGGRKRKKAACYKT